LTPVLLDTGLIVALQDRSERHHEECAAIISEVEAPVLTCEAVIAGACYLLRGMKTAADAVLKNVEHGTFLAEKAT
jgi:predicted nucleic acid-binding protein